MAASSHLIKPRYLIEVDGKEQFEAETFENALTLLLGLILLMSAYGWIKVEAVKDDPPTYKIMLIRQGSILRNHEEHIITLREVKPKP